MLSESEIVEGCRHYNKSAQKALYDKYASSLRILCMRYAKNLTEAEDILQEAFIKIFSKVKQYSGKGSFEGWLKRIVVNTAISYFRKSNKKGYLYNIELIKESDIETEEENSESDINSSDIKSVILNADFSSEDILKIINNLPENYRIVFNLYVFEEYGHKEIGEMLNMSANTSKSQLSRARKLIQKQLLESIRKTTVA